MSLRVFWHISDFEAQGYYRSVLPCRHLRLPGIEITASPDLTTLDYDAFVFHRLLKPGFLSVVEDIKRRKKLLVWELDDDLFGVPDHNPAARFYNSEEAQATLRWTAQAADRIIVSTAPLKEVIARVCGDADKVYVCPNLVDADDWPRELPAPNEEGQVKILWAGSNSHERDLMEIVLAVDRVIEEYGDGVRVLFFGHLPECMSEYVRIQHSLLAMAIPARRYGGRLGLVQGVPHDQYHGKLLDIRPDIGLAPLQDTSFNCCKSNVKWLELLDIRPDIGLAPLQDTSFNCCKSNIKWLEYSMAGAAFVGSDLDPYRCMTWGHEGLLVAPGDSQGWYRAISHLVENDDDRRQMAASARDAVLTTWSWQGPGRKPWETFLETL